MKEYVYKADPAFRYEIEETYKADGWTEYRVKMISGTWLTKQEVNHPEWWHWVTIVVPDEVAETEALVIIGGGSTRDKEPEAANELLIQAAVGTKSIVAEISNIPFQPLNYVGDERMTGPRTILLPMAGGNIWKVALKMRTLSGWRDCP